ncbi:MAG: APC family permease [Actinoplanes sp.]
MPLPKSESPAQSALASSRLGVGSVVATVMAAAAPLTVIAGGATGGFAVTGITGIPLGYLMVAVILGIFAVSFVAMSGKIVNAGAFYTYVTRGLGKILGVSAAFVAVAAYNVMQVGLYGGFGVALVAFAELTFGVELPWGAWALGGWLLVAVLGGRRIDISGRLLAVLLFSEVAVAMVYAVVQVAHPAGGRVSLTTLEPGNLVTGPSFWAALAAAAIALSVAVAGFVGFEGAPVFSEETKDPTRTVPSAVYISVAFIAVSYAFCVWSMTVATGPDLIVERATAEGSDLIFNLSSPYLPAFMITLGRLLFVSSLFAALLAFHQAAARYFFALGRERVLPAWLGRTDPATRAPLNGSLLQSGIGLAGIGLFVAFRWDPFVQMFFWLTVLGGFGVLILMTVTSVSVFAFFRNPANREGVGVFRATVAPILSSILLGIILVTTVVKFDVLIGVAPDHPARWILQGGFAVAAVLGIGWALILKAYRPQVFASLGLGAARIDTRTPSVATSPAGTR